MGLAISPEKGGNTMKWAIGLAGALSLLTLILLYRKEQTL